MSSESSSSSTLMSQDLGLDPSDPLNLLLHNHSQHDGADTDTDSASTPPDWNSLSSMWPPVEDNKMDFNMDFNIMDMSFDPSVGIEPIALNYTYAAPDPFQFTFESSHMSASSSESGSTSGSFSPLAAYSPPASEFDEDPATELASRVRKTAGVVLAVQINQDQKQQQQHAEQQQQQVQVQPPTPASPPPAFTTTPVPPPVLATATAAPQTRPKTSHTTIERRYRTNLNARIQSLRQAVPALRVVDRAAALKAGDTIDDDGPEDIIDARGFVDGVKVARKCSKANVLGKAVEYIRVLKNREARLARELAGLKTLLGGLVGGRELLREWEREWAARFGGPETDELSDNHAAPEEDGDEEDDDSDEEGVGRKRKKPKTEPKPKPERKAPAPAADGEKKKRGRPRKVVPLPTSASIPALSTSVPMQAQQEMSQRQYLLGAFALFSFFANTGNVSVAPVHHAHEGHVLTRVPVAVEGMGMLQMFHLLVSIAVLASVLLPLGKSVYSRLRGTKVPVVATVVVADKTPAAPPTPTSEDDDTDVDTELSLSSTSGNDDEPATLSAVPAAPDHAAAEACILNASTPLSTRLRTAVRLYRTTTTSSPVDDRRLLALLLRPVPFLGARLAAHLWDANLGLGVDEAAARLPTSPADKGVLSVLEEGVARERLRTVSARAFSETVFASEKTEANTEERERALNSARALGGRVRLLATRVGRVLGGGELDADTDVDDEGVEGDVEKLLSAIVLYRRVFGADSAQPQDAQALRCTLGSSEVFEDVLVEEARDRVVDLLTGEQ
ncbi:hypothetical protein B0H11DRAFT_2292054 [Mycena galericulata]|nr:hypothetical protein B0H11DRAFT_2292054 [Mycena galericulata]